MKKIFFAYPNKHFLYFIKEFLEQNNYRADYTHTGGLIFNEINKFGPDLIILDKTLSSMDLKGFFIRKKMTKQLAHTPVFLIGDFAAQELLHYKKQNVKGFIPIPIDPYALLTKINHVFGINEPITKLKTPMLIDIHVKGKIIILQIEGNFDPNKIIILNYKLRAYCKAKKLKDPRFLYVFPSFYPETITQENIDLLFSFREYEEFDIKNNQIKILTNVQEFIEFYRYTEGYEDYELVPDLIYGIRTLNIDFDNSKKIPINFLKDGGSYILDLYDNEGMMRIPAYSTITQNMIDYLKKMGERSLTYYSDQNITEVKTADNHVSSMENFDKIEAAMNEYEHIDRYITHIIDPKNEKINLYMSKLRGKNSIMVSASNEDFEVLKNAIGDYLVFERNNDGNQIIEKIQEKETILVFIDFMIDNPNALQVLQLIRSRYTRKDITVIIITKKIDRNTLANFKRSGADYIIISPFSTSRILQKIFHFISADRKF